MELTGDTRELAPFAPGLVSVSFRLLSPREIVDLARRAGLVAIEWGGDVHVPPGDLARARQVRQLTAEAGLAVLAYGSYLRLGEDDPATFAAAVETAATLGARALRVWAGRRGSAEADDEYRQRIVHHAHLLADVAVRSGVAVCYEFHANTLTDTDESASELFASTRHPAIRTLWQPPNEKPLDACLLSLRRVVGLLHHVHVFHWPIRGHRAPLAEGAERWRAYIKLLADSGRRCPLLLEFVRGDDPEQLIHDAATLRSWVGEQDTG